MGKSNPGNQFVVDLSVLTMPDAALDRIDQAVQKAVLLELASVDLAPEVTVRMSRPRDSGFPGHLQPGPTRGIWVEEPPEARA